MSAATALLREHLLQRQLKGETHVLLRRGLLEKPRSSAIRTAEPPPAPTPEARSHSAKTPDTPKPRAATLQTSGVTKAEKIASLAAQAENWEPAKNLHSLRQTLVFSTGNPEASIMLIGEAPGAEEERQREPFVGPAGQKLTAILKAMGLDRSQVYISNICKFRPGMENQGSANRVPTAEEMAACLPFILTEIEIIRPQVIIALGGTAAKGLGFEGSVNRLRARFHDFNGTPVMITFHPSYLLREEKLGGGVVAKRQVWEDMLQVMQKLAMPISEKQRGYFKKA